MPLQWVNHKQLDLDEEYLESQTAMSGQQNIILLYFNGGSCPTITLTYKHIPPSSRRAVIGYLVIFIPYSRS